MIVSEITTENVSDYLRLEYEELSENQIAEIENLMSIAILFIESSTGLSAEELDEHDDFVIVVYILVQDMYDNRTLYVDNKNLNKVVDTILSMHSVNLL